MYSLLLILNTSIMHHPLKREICDDYRKDDVFSYFTYHEVFLNIHLLAKHSLINKNIYKLSNLLHCLARTGRTLFQAEILSFKEITARATCRAM